MLCWDMQQVLSDINWVDENQRDVDIAQLCARNKQVLKNNLTQIRVGDA
jgi:hypothetical protein